MELSDRDPLTIEEKLELVRRRRAAELDVSLVGELRGGEREELEARMRQENNQFEMG